MAAPAPYDNPPKSGVVQEISKYHVTAQNKDSAAVQATRLDHPSPVNPAVVSEPAPKNTPVVTRLTGSEEEKLRKTRENASPKPSVEAHSDSYGTKIKPIEGPTTVSTPTNVKTSAGLTVHQHTKRSAEHVPEHKEENKKEDATKPEEDSHVHIAPVRHDELKRTRDEVKRPYSVAQVEKRDTESVKVQDKPQVNIKPTITHPADKNEDKKTINPTPSCNTHECHNADHHHKREATSAPTNDQINVKATSSPIPAQAVHDSFAAHEQHQQQQQQHHISEKTTSKPIAKRESVTTESTSSSPAVVTSAPHHHLHPTLVHSTFSQTWTRPQAVPEADKAVAASENKPTVADVSAVKPVHAIHETKEGTSTTAAPSSTTSAGHRVRRGVDQTEEQDGPTSPKPTKAWWRSLEFNKKEEKPEAKTDVPKVEDKKINKEEVKKDEVKKEDSKTAPAVVAASLKKDKRETQEKTSDVTAAPAVNQKQTRPAEQLPYEDDNKPPHFVRPVPVSQILGKEQA